MGKSSKRRLGAFQSSGLVNPSKTLLANIRFASVDDPIKTLCVTSTTSGEGKTTTSTNLACAIASAGQSVLIVDADMRKRSLSAMLDLHPKYNLYSILSGECPIEKAITPTKYENLFFLDAEQSIPNPPDILSTRRFEALVAMLKDMFDYVIFDTPPVGMFVDAAIISSLTDGTIFVIREKSTKKAMAEKSIEQLKASKGRLLGIVTTFSKAPENDYYYAYYSTNGKRVSKKEKAKIDAAIEAGKMVGGDAQDSNARRITNAQLSSEDIEAWMRKAGRKENDARNYGRHATNENAHATASETPRAKQDAPRQNRDAAQARTNVEPISTPKTVIHKTSNGNPRAARISNNPRR
jgi:capsular exopolysaccharide synthesis family protein